MSSHDAQSRSIADSGERSLDASTYDRTALDRVLVRGVAWTAAAKVITQVLAWSCTVLVARLLVPADYGLVEMAGVYLGLVVLVTELGLSSAVVYMRSLSRHQVAQLNALAVGVACAAMAVSIAVAPLLARFYGEPRLVPLLLFMSTSFVLLGLKTVPYGLLERAMDFRYLAILEVFQGAVTAPLTLVLAWSGFGYWSLALGQVVGVTVGMGILVLRDPRGFAWPQFSALREAMTLSYHLVIARVAWYAYSNSDYVVVGWQLGAGQLGAYALAFTIASAPVDKVAALLARVTRPTFASIQDRPAELKRMFIVASAALAFVTIPASVGLALVAPDLVVAVLGEKWADAVLPLMLLALCTPIRSLAPLLPQILNATGDSRFAMRLNVIAAIVLPAAFLAASVGGLAAVASVWVLVYPLFVLASAIRVGRRLDLRAREYLGAIWPPIFGSAVMGAIVLVARASLPANWPIVTRLTLLILLGAAIFFAVMFTVFWRRTMWYLDALRRLRQN